MTGIPSRSMPMWGARPTLSGVRFGLWAPALEFVDLFIEGEIEPLRLQRGDDGWHSLTTPRAQAGSRYWFVRPDGTRMTDPASFFQPDGANGPSQVIDHVAYRWREPRWKGLPWHTAVLYEIDVGAFSVEGTFNAVREQLRRFVRLGVTAIHLGSIAEPGNPYAPNHRYGSPEEVKALVEDAHSLGLMVFLDVAGSPMASGGDAHSRPVLDFIVGNALHWVERFHFDGVRVGEAPTHILTELAEVLRARVPYRQVHLILREETDRSELLERSGHGEVQLYNARCRADLRDAFDTHLPPDAVVSMRKREDSEPALRAMTAIQLLMPQIPLLSAPDLDWSQADSLDARRWRERYGWLLELRHREIVPRIPSIERGGLVRELAPEVIEVVWHVGTVEEIVLIANFGDAPADVRPPPGRVLWREGSPDGPGLSPWAVLWLLRPIAI